MAATGTEAVSHVCTLNKLLKLFFKTDGLARLMYPTLVSNRHRTTVPDVKSWHKVLKRTKVWWLVLWVNYLYSHNNHHLSINPTVLQPQTGWITPLSERRNDEQKGNAELCHTQLGNGSKHLSCLHCYVMQQLSPFAGHCRQAHHHPFWRSTERISLSSKAQNGLRQLSTSLSLSEMHRDTPLQTQPLKWMWIVLQERKVSLQESFL